MQLMGPAFMDFAMNNRVAAPIGNRHPANAAAPHGVFPCLGDDRWISIAVANDDEWIGLIAAMGQPEWAQAESFSSQAARLLNLDELHEFLAQWTSQFDDYLLATELQQAGVAAAPVLNIATCWLTRTIRRAAPSSKSIIRWASRKPSMATTSRPGTPRPR